MPSRTSPQCDFLGYEHLQDFETHVRVEQDIYLLTGNCPDRLRPCHSARAGHCGRLGRRRHPRRRHAGPHAGDGRRGQATGDGCAVPQVFDPTPSTAIPPLGPAWGVPGEDEYLQREFTHDWIRPELEKPKVRIFGPFPVLACSLSRLETVARVTQRDSRCRQSRISPVHQPSSSLTGRRRWGEWLLYHVA